MLYLRTTINGQYRYIDLFDDERIEMEYSYAEIQDITSKNSTFTKSFTIPGSKENNDIFQHYYDLNISMTDYDVRDIFEAEFLKDGYEIIKGYIRLENVSIQNKNVTYNVTFYSNIGLLTSKIGDKVLADLDYTELEHTYDTDNIVRSIYDPDFSGGTEPYEDGRITYMLAQYGYEYDNDYNVITDTTPIIDFRNGTTPGYFDFIGSPLRFYYLKPSIQVKWMYEKIFSEAGFKVKSNFFDTAYFKRFYLPLTFNTDSLYLNQAVRPEFHFLDDSRSLGSIVDTPITWNEIDNGVVIDTKNLSRGRQFPVLVDNINASTYSPFAFKIISPGLYTLKLTWGGYNTKLNRTDPRFDDPAIATIYFHQVELGGVNGTSGTTLFDYGRQIPAGSSFMETHEFQVYLDPSFSYEFSVDKNGTIYPMAWNYFEMEILDGPRTIVGPVDLRRELPENEETQMDFISTINQRFNLLVIPDNEDENTIIVEPIIDYLNRGEVLDWSDKLDHNSNISILPTTSVLNGTLYMGSQNDEDYGNLEFTKTKNIIYGTSYKKLGVDYKNTQTDFLGIVSNAVDDVLSNVNSPNITIPIFYITREDNNEGEVNLFYNARKTKPRVMFRGLNLPSKNVGYSENPSGITINTFYIEDRQINIFPNYNRFTTYPFGLTGFTHAVNFNKTHRFRTTEYDFSCYKDLYDVYYKEYVEDLTNSDNRILIASFFLEPNEISELKGNETIFISGNYYRINKINGYNLTTTDLTEVELIKITGEYTSHPVKYYKLQNCSNPFDIRYTNTDLNYTLWAYVGKRVKIGTNCYTILNDTYGENKVYEKLTIPFQNNSFIPQIYNNCSCTDLIQEVNIYNELDCVTGQPPIPPQPSGDTYYYYVLEKCDAQQQILARSTTYYTLGQIVRTSTGGNTCYFVFDFTLTQNTNDIISTFVTCEECAESVPTPTPTRTPTPTPTPSPTPCNCREYYIENRTLQPISTNYKDCEGNILTAVIPGDSFIVDCVCEGSIEDRPGLEYRDLGECIENTPTPTSTSVTPTPTPSTCECYQYSITNFSDEASGTYQAILCGECDNAPTTYEMGPSQSVIICACNGSVTTMDVNVSITKGACC